MEPTEQTLLLADGVIDTESQENTELPQIQCKTNIYNAYLLVRYREDMINHKDTTWLGIFAYFIAGVQWAALMLLGAIVIDNSGVVRPWMEMQWIPADWNTLVMFPFFIIAGVTCRRDIHKLYQDLDAFAILKIPYGFHVTFFKLGTEVALTFFGSMTYLIILALYSDSHGNWSSIFNAILNLLAYQFITNVDENAYLAIEQILRLNSKTFELFDVTCQVKEHNLSKKVHEEMLDVIIWPLLFQGLFSRSYVIIILPLIILPIWMIIKVKRGCDKYIHAH
eukprot:104597_1